MAKVNPTIYDVAKLASVSLATASRVMNGVDKVAPETRDRVLAAIKELNYQPSSVAKELASRKNTNVAIIVPELNYTYIAHVVAGIMESAKEKGYDALIFTTKESKKDITSTISKVNSIRPNGIIIFNDSLTDEELTDLIRFDIPTVSLGIDLKTISSVSRHYKTQIMNLVEESLSRNKEVYFIKVKGSGRLEQRILNGIVLAHEAKGLKFNNIIEVEDSYKNTYEVMKNLLPTIKNGFFLASRDSIALAALNAAIDLKKNVPNDFEFMAVIGTKYSELSRPELSSFDIDMKGLGKAGMKILAKKINGEYGEHEVVTKKLPFAYIKRGSTM